MLNSFDGPFEAVVFGAGGGIGRAFIDQLAASSSVSRVHAFSRTAISNAPATVEAHSIDILNDSALKDAAALLKASAPRLIIVATGILHDDGLQPEKTWRHLDASNMETVFKVNTIAPALIMKHFLGILPREGKSVFAALSARVGSISDNHIGGWFSYRASKAALNMMLRTGAIELSRRWPDAVCIGLHPGTVDTGLSKPFQGNVSSKKLFTPSHCAAQLIDVIDGIDCQSTGKVFDYAGKDVPF